MGLRDRIATERNGTGTGDGVSYYRKRLLEEVDLSEFATLSEPQRRARLERVVGRMVSREGPVLTTAERTRLIRQVIDEAIGLGVLEPLLSDPTVTEIMVNGVNEIFVEREGRLQRADISFGDEAQLYQTIDRIVSQVNRRVDESSPMVDARLPTGERVNVIIPPLALHGPTITIRRFPRLFTLEQLVGLESVDRPTEQLLRAFVRARLNVVISGGTGAGKTTLLNALSAAVPATERIITVEDNAELRLQQPHVVSLEARPPNVEGRGEITIRDLVRNSLRMRPDRIIVGEVRGAETLDMLQALNTGHEGSLVTVHANSADDAIHRLETLATMSDLNLPFEALRDQINNAIDVIVQIDRYPDGRRRLAEVAVVASNRREPFRLAPVATFAADPIGPDRRVTGRFAHAPLPEQVARRLMLSGEVVPGEFGERGLMGRDGQALLLLVAVLLIALLGIVTYVSGAARRAELASRGGPGDEEGGLRRLVGWLDARLRRTERGRRLATWLSSGAVPVSAAEFLLGGLLATFVLYVIGTLFLPPLMALIIAILCAAGGARTWVEKRRARRRDLFVAQLPDVARLLANGASAGLSLPAAIQLAARELDEPAATEMRTVIEELRVGQPVDEALDSMRRRLPSRELGVLMTTLVIQQRAGGDTVRALTELGHALDARKDLMREIKTLLSGSVFTSYLVAGIGVATILLMNVMSPGVMREMATSVVGVATLAFCGSLWAVAFLLIRRTTKVEL